MNQGKSDAKAITLVLGKGDGKFSDTNDAYLNTPKTWGQYRHAALLDKDKIIAIRNDETPIILNIKNKD